MKKSVSFIISVLLITSFAFTSFAAPSERIYEETGLIDAVEVPEQGGGEDTLLQVIDDATATDIAADEEYTVGFEEEAKVPEYTEPETESCEEAAAEEQEVYGEETQAVYEEKMQETSAEETQEAHEEEAVSEEAEVTEETSATDIEIEVDGPVYYGNNQDAAVGTNRELFDALANREMGFADAELQATTIAGCGLTGINQAVYSKIRQTVINSAANGTVSNVISFTADELGLKSAYTAAELGVSEIISGGSLTGAAMTAMYAKLDGLNMQVVINALLTDCPLELYWYDKDSGYTYTYFTLSGNSTQLRFTGEFRVTMCVSPDFAGGSAITRLNRAKQTAQSIVNRYAGCSMSEKVKGFANEICALTDYNWSANYGNYSYGYGDPWQLISVFDGDSSTTVVCEGYTKAMQYLCELSGIRAIQASGTSNGESHMWNVIAMDDGRNYLVDVTKSDAGSYCSEAYILKGVTGTPASGYSINGTRYVYGYDTTSVLGTSQLTLASNAYGTLPAVSLGDVNGFAYSNGYWGWYKNGQLQTGMTGVIKGTVNGVTGWYYITNGLYDTSATGLTKRADGSNNSWYYVEDGVYTKSTGIAQRADHSNNSWYYVEKGVYTKSTGIARRIDNYNSTWYYVQNGVYTKSTGIAQRADGSNTAWYYVSNGAHTTSVTGIAQKADGSSTNWYFVKNGVYTKATGLAKKADGSSSTWYYVYNGAYTKATVITGRADGSNNSRYYAYNGKFNKYTGYVTVDGTTYYLVNGVVQ
ncbi:MAG: hypothetical protein HUJ76_02715 [Parasporobacterium sp.]|nr:hypothetical protein [Parasporobacterium sp.]